MGGWFWMAALPYIISAVGSIGSSLINKNAASNNASNINNLQYQPIDLGQLQSQAQQAAQQNLVNSISLEKQNEPGLSATRFGLQGQLASDLAGGGNVPTDVANQVSRSAITGSNSAGLLGAAGPITAATLGTTAMNIRNANQMKAMQLLQGNQLPTSGLDPGALASASIANTNAQNQFTLGKAGALNNVNNANAAANSGMMGAGAGGLMQILGQMGPLLSGSGGDTMGSFGGSVGGGAFGAMCWVAREVFGEDNPKWLQFRRWMLTESPAPFRWAYITFGEQFAAWLHRHPSLKPSIRAWMEARIS